MKIQGHDFFKLSLTSIIIDCVSESLCKSFEGGPSYGTISLQCNSLSQIHAFKCLIQAEINMTGRTYMGKVMTQVWLKSIRNE